MTTNPNNVVVTLGSSVVTPVATYVVSILVLINHERKSEQFIELNFKR